MLSTPFAHAQQPEDDTPLIQSMLDADMGAAVQAFLADPPSDPDLAEQIRDGLVKGYLPTLRNDTQAYLQAIRDVIVYQQNMYADPVNEGHWERPKWGADLAQQLMINALPDLYLAGSFALVGFPDAGQRRVVDLVADESYRLLSRSEDEFLALRTRLRGESDFVEKYVNTGRWDALQQYQQLNVPYNRAWAIVYLLTQPDDGPYFAGKDNPATIRARLIDQARADLDVAEEKATSMALPDDLLARIDLLRSELAIRSGEYDEALRMVVRVRDRADAMAFTKFLGRLIQARALDQADRADPLNSLLDELQDEPIVRENPLHPVLIADRRFLSIYDKALATEDASQKQALLSEAFDVYVKLLSSDRIDERFRGAIQQFVEDRYQRQIPAGLDATQLPGALQLASIRAKFDEGEQFSTQGRADEAKARYQQVIDLAETLLQRGDLKPTVESEALFYKGYAQLRAGQAGYAAQSFLQLADRFPDQARGEQAIQVALINLLQPLFQARPDEPTIRQLLEEGYNILFTRYPTIPLADLATYDYAAYLRQTEQYTQAIRAYKKVPQDHEAHLSAMYERLACLGVLWRDAEGAGVADYAGQIIEGVKQFLARAEPRVDNLPAERRETIRRFIASARLLRVSVRMETFDQVDDALAELQEVRQQFGDMPAIQTRIQGVIIRAYQKQGEFDKAEAELRQYMQNEPDKAGPLALGVLQSINQQIKAEQDPQRRQMLADVAVNLADNIVLPWARTQNPDVEQQISYELMPAQSLMAAGKWQQALQRFNAIITRHGDPARSKIEIVEGQAECHFHTANVSAASQLYNRIIRFYQESDAARDRHFWNAQMRIYQLMDQHAAKTDNVPNTSIFRGIRVLTTRYPDLGGPPYAQTLKQLQTRHAPR